MFMEKHDIIVIGAGPVGAYTSEMCRKTLRTLLIDQKEEPGSPIQCSGLISRNVDSFFRPSGCIEHTVKGAVLHSPGGGKLELMKKKTAAYVIDRQRFDRSLLDRNKSDKLLGTRVRKISVTGKGVTVSTDKGTLCSDVLVGADGPNSIARRHFRQRAETVPGIIAIEDKPGEEDFVELWFDRKLTDGFLWRIPRGQRTEYGMLGAGSSFPILRRFFRLGEFEKRAGSIPFGLHRTFFSRTLLVGDAASQTKPWSGGGIIYGMACGRIASDVLREAFRKNDFSEAFLSRYEERWHKTIGRSIRAGLMFRELYKSLTNKQIDNIFKSLEGMDMSRLDMDFPLMDILD
jgi:digeranylgeranylglycerophospholipid reductase